MTFRDPLYLWLLIPWCALLFFYFYRGPRRSSLLYSSVKVLGEAPRSWKVRLRALPEILKFLSIFFVILALARPQRSDELTKKNVDGIDIMVALDISDSMLVEDMKPNNRLESAKDTLRKFIEKRTSDRIGIIIFAGESFTLVPLTLDYDLLYSRIADITTAQQARIKDGTAIGVALANAAGKLRESTSKSRVIIFMTDGESNSGTIDPLTALEVAKGYGLKIYSIGIGQDGPTRIPIFTRDRLGNTMKTYQPFESTINENLLQKMASDTGGKYYRASREDSLQGVFTDINELEKTKIDVNRFVRYQEKYLVFLWPALFCYLVGLLLGYTLLRRNP